MALFDNALWCILCWVLLSASAIKIWPLLDTCGKFVRSKCCYKPYLVLLRFHPLYVLIINWFNGPRKMEITKNGVFCSFFLAPIWIDLNSRHNNNRSSDHNRSAFLKTDFHIFETKCCITSSTWDRITHFFSSHNLELMMWSSIWLRLLFRTMKMIRWELAEFQQQFCYM